MDIKILFTECLEHATAAIAHVKKQDLTKPTPDEDWDVQRLLNHMFYELAWVPDIVYGKSSDDVGDIYEGDLIGDDISASWDLLSMKALDAVEEADLELTAYLSSGTVTVEEYLYRASSENLIHAWDLASAIGQSLIMEPAVAEAVYGYSLSREDEIRESDLFDDPLPVDDKADVQTKLLALYGRKA